MRQSCWASVAVLIVLLLSGAALSAASAASTVHRGETPYAIDVWETEDGLPWNSVISMAQTRDGYLWLGTIDGLARFDGSKFTVFNENNAPGLGTSPIISLFEDTKTNLWIGTENGGVVLVENGNIRRLGIGQGSRESRLAGVCEDAAGRVWLYTYDGQLWSYHAGQTNAYRVGTMGPSRFRSAVCEQGGSVWLGTDSRLIGFDPIATAADPALQGRREMGVGWLDYLLASKEGGYWRLAGGQITKWKGNRPERSLGSYPWNVPKVTSACEDQEGNLVVGTSGAGLFWFDKEGRATSLSTNNGLSYNFILSLLVDREGNLWVGTDGGGLNRIKRQTFDVLEGSVGLVVQSVSEDAEGGLWIGTSGGAALWKNGTLERFGRAQGLADPYVRAVLADSEKRVWFGTWSSVGISPRVDAGLFQWHNGEIYRDLSSPISDRPVLAIHQDREGALWFGTYDGMVRLNEKEWRTFGKSNGLSSLVIRAIADDPNGNLWVGTEGGGLQLGRDGVFSQPPGQDSRLENISSLYCDADGVLWVATFGRGLARLQGDRWTHYSSQDGLISDSLGYLIADQQGYLWIGSNAGLMRVPLKQLNDFAAGRSKFISVQAYGKRDGLPNRECTRGSQPAARQTRDGRLWFPTIKGLAFVNPAQLRSNPYPPPVIVEAVFIDGQPQTTSGLRTHLTQEISVPAAHERLEIHYTGLNLAAPERARYKYRLVGHETAWTEAGNSRVARYSKLPPGDYRFVVTACNEDGVWNEQGGSFGLIVLTPMWRTWWFLSLSALAVLGIIVAIVHYLSTQKLQRQVERLRSQEELEKERARIARDIHDQVGASLTQVSLLSELVESDKDSPAEVEAHARQICQTTLETTRALDEIVWAVNPSNDTLDGLITYICKYAQEYLAVAGLRYRLDVPPNLPPVVIPPDLRHNVFLASKEAITNIVRHAQATEAQLRLRIEPDRFILEIEDNGRGIPDLAQKFTGPRNGLRNMRHRMQELDGEFTITPGTDGGTLVRLISPLSNRHNEAVRKAS